MALLSCQLVIWILFMSISVLSTQSSYFTDGHMEDLEDAMTDKSDKSDFKLTQEELALYDLDKDGKLNHKEIASYIQDVLGYNLEPQTKTKKKIRPRQKPFSKKTSSNNVEGKFGVKEISIAIMVAFLTVIATTWYLYKHIHHSKSYKGVPIEDLRVARLRKLESPAGKPVKPQRNFSQVTQGKNQSPTEQLVDDRNSSSDDDLQMVCGSLDTEKRKQYEKPRKNDCTDKPSHGETANSTPMTRSTISTAKLINTSQNKSTVSGCKPKLKGDDKEISSIFKVQEEELSFSQSVQMVLSQVLDCTIELQKISLDTSKSLHIASNSTHAKIALVAEEMPTNKEDMKKKVSKIVSKRMCLELEPMKFALKCYDRCTHTPDVCLKTHDVWIALTDIIKEDCTNTVLHQLVQAIASPTSAEEDLWSEFCNSSNSQGSSFHFLGCVAGWSSDGAVVSNEFLTRLLEHAKVDSLAKQTFLNMISISGKHIQSIPRLDEVALHCSSLLKGLEILINQPIMIDFLSEQLLKEVEESSKEMGSYFQEKSLFSSFLSLTTLEAKVTGKSRASQPFNNLPHFPTPDHSDVERVQSQIQDALHSCQAVVHKVIRRVLIKHQQSALGWLAAVVMDNDLRSAVLLSEDHDEAIACNGYMMNLCHVLLQLCEPFFVSKGDSKIADISPHYSTSDACRLNHDNERTLSGRCIGSDVEGKEVQTNFILPENLTGKFVLKTEIFHITQRALHIGLVNSIQHYNRLVRQYLILKEMNEDKDKEKYVQQILSLFVFQWRTVLEDKQFMRLCCEFYLTSAVWLYKALENCALPTSAQEISEEDMKEKQKVLLSSIPEFYVKDMCTWFYYVATNIPQELRGLKIIHFVDCCTAIMSSKGFVPGPMVSSKIVTALLAFADSCNRKQTRHSLLETASWGSGVEGELAAAVVVSPVIREKLASALIQTYTSVDIVEGLDVDKEEFDKFTSRSEVIKLLQCLWKYPESRALLKGKCQQYEVQEFLSAILDSLLYLLNDGLSRLTNVCKLQKSIEDQTKWQEVNWEEQEQKTNFLKNEEHVSKSFMLMATTTLTFLAMITEEPQVARCFTCEPLSQRAASSIIGFLDSLCGPKRLDLKVKDMEKYSFNPRDLLVKLGLVLIRIANCGREESNMDFVNSMCNHPDYSKSILEQAVRTVKRYELITPDSIAELEAFVNECEQLRKDTFGEASDISAGAQGEDLLKQRDGIEPDGEESLEQMYVEQLKDQRHSTCELLEVTAFQNFRSQPISQRSTKIRTLMKEITQLKETLPIHPNSSVFVRQDEERMDFIRALITGPVDTPYSRGCFLLDVYFPSNYPSVPPLVKLITTGNGTVRFNPNLYADGKVCLSLLGTWHGGDASEKWNPKASSLYQVLLSIQAMILIPDPCFNEPGYEGIRGTDDGDALSRKYNATIRLATIRHAMVAQLRNPPTGFEDIINVHFKLQKDVILRQVYDWLQQCNDSEEERRMRRNIEELKIELDKL